MKRLLAVLLLIAALLLCGCTPYEEETTTPSSENGDAPNVGDSTSGENGDTDDLPIGNLPFDGGYDPEGWT